jgi:hypothetical protein
LSKPLALFTAAGVTDFNFLHAKRIDSRAAAAGYPHRLEFFDGPHAWMPEPMAARAVDWLEREAMRAGLRARDEALERAIDERLDVPELFRGDDERTRRADARELAGVAAASAAFRAFAADPDPPFLSALSRDLRVDEWMKAAAAGGYAGQSAQRVLEFVFVHTSFYLPESFADAKRFDRAAAVLEVAARIHPDRPRVWYELAARRAQSRARAKAVVEALDRAVAAGFKDAGGLAADERFVSVRGADAFKAILDRLAGR